jgi:hypothetical protein
MNLEKIDNISASGRRIKLVNVNKEKCSTQSYISENYTVDNLENHEKFLIFSSDRDDIVNKWVSVLNYFINW